MGFSIENAGSVHIYVELPEGRIGHDRAIEIQVNDRNCGNSMGNGFLEFMVIGVMSWEPIGNS